MKTLLWNLRYEGFTHFGFFPLAELAIPLLQLDHDRLTGGNIFFDNIVRIYSCDTAPPTTDRVTCRTKMERW